MANKKKIEKHTRGDWIFNNRWRVMGIWIIGFTAMNVYGFMENRHRVDDIAQVRAANCTRISTVLQGLLSTSEQSLGKPGSAGYAYYKDHPDELAAAKKQTHTLVVRLDPKKCK